MLQEDKSAASSIFEFLGLTVNFRDGSDDVIATLALSTEKIRKLVDMARELRGEETASLASPQELAWEP